MDLGLGGEHSVFTTWRALFKKEHKTMNTVRFEALKRTTEGHHWLRDTVTPKQGSPPVGCRAKRHSEAKDQKEGLISCSK